MNRPWYEEAFEAGYLDVYPHRDLTAARAEVRGLVERGVAGRVLDAGCGYGRHLLALLELGLEAVGLDLSIQLLRHARRLEGAPALRGRLVRGDFRRLPFRAASFGSVVMLFSSFGYFDDAGNAAVLEEVARVLCPGGTAVFDLMNPARVRSGLVAESERRSGPRVLRERRRIEGSRVQKAVLLREADGTERSWREDVRLYGADEFRALARRRGLEVVRLEGDFDGARLGADSPRQIVWTERRGGVS